MLFAISAVGTFEKYERPRSMSGSVPKAAIVNLPWHFRDVPGADIGVLFDHFIGAGEERRRYFDPNDGASG